MAGYWDSRKHYKYYIYIKYLCNKYIKPNYSIIDFGCRDTEVIFDIKCKEKYLLDIQNTYSQQQQIKIKEKNIIFLQKDIYKINYINKFNVSLCLQTLEHLESPSLAFQKIYSATTDYIILSLPYKWGYCHYHKYHMIEENGIFEWTKKIPVNSLIIEDNNRVKRIVNLYKKDYHNERIS